MLGEFPLEAATSTNAMLQFATLRTKVTSCRLGVRLYGMLLEVSFAALIKVCSVWLSMFLFVGGVVRLNDLST